VTLLQPSRSRVTLLQPSRSGVTLLQPSRSRVTLLQPSRGRVTLLQPPPGYPRPVPRYEFRCRECSDVFEVNRPMSASGEPAACPAGHTDTVKLLSAVALAGVRNGGAPARAPVPAGGGGCCGGGCGCG
jgi:putative FmdB family regulatory protein